MNTQKHCVFTLTEIIFAQISLFVKIFAIFCMNVEYNKNPEGVCQLLLNILVYLKLKQRVKQG